MVTRRRFLAQSGPFVLAPWLEACAGRQPSVSERREALAFSNGATVAFLHGVASGDPLPEGVILWTRVTPSPHHIEAGSAAIVVQWRVATDPGLNAPVAEGHTEATAASDYTVKIDVRDLSPGSTYHYQFVAANVASPLGKTRTLPIGSVERLRLAVTSCANYPYGFFHAYRRIAERTDLDVVLYLGDYLYEYANGTYGDGEPLGRVPEPDREIVSLEDYRRRHAQYKSDPDLQEVHRQHPCVAVWDDHELANNTWRDGAQNHQSSAEGDWRPRLRSAIRAFLEWMPIRNPDAEHPGRIYRHFAWGDLADLIMLDTRVIGRDRQVDGCDQAGVQDAGRSLLGSEQESWFFEQLTSSKQRATRWRLIGQQVRFALALPDPPEPGCVGNGDNWGGYAASRRRVLDALQAGIDNVIILTGDAHVSWGFDIPRDPFDPASYDGATGRGSLAVELVTPGVTSPGSSDPAEAARTEALYKSTHPHVRFAEHFSQGYMVLDVSRERARAEWYYVGNVREPAATERLGGGLQVLAGESHLTPLPEPVTAAKSP
jgi:alkaline phosphatase D